MDKMSFKRKFFITGLCFLSIMIILHRLFTMPIGWMNEKVVVPDSYKVREFQMSSKGNLIALAFEKSEKGRTTLFVTVSIDGGKRFFQPVVVYETSSGKDVLYPLNPQVAISSKGVIFVAWQDMNRDDSLYRLFYSVSANIGANWSKPAKLNLKNSMEIVPYVSFDDTDVMHIFYHGLDGDSFKLFHSSSVDGIVFTSPIEIAVVSQELKGAFFPAVYILGQNIFVVWQGKEMLQNQLSDELYFVRSQDGGTTWSKSLRITNLPGNNSSPSMVLSGKDLYCVYQNNANLNWELMMLKGSDYGSIWSEPFNVFRTNTNSYSPRAILSGTDISIFWYDNREGINKISCRKYSLAEKKFSDLFTISENTLPASKPKAVVLGGQVLCVWTEGGKIIGKFSDNYAGPPDVHSSTHPVDTWSNFSTAEIEWAPVSDDSGISGYATLINKDKNSDPEIQNVPGNITAMKIPSLEDGITYFHIRTIDKAGNMSRTIHYPIRVTKNPLSIPNVESPTHVEGKGTDNDSPVLKWSVDDTERVKGYIYGLSKDNAEVPDKFTNDTEISFQKLPIGRYFFSVRAVDKTDNPGRIATYELIIGEASEIDQSMYEKIAKNESGIKNENDTLQAKQTGNKNESDKIDKKEIPVLIPEIQQGSKTAIQLPKEVEIVPSVVNNYINTNSIKMKIKFKGEFDSDKIHVSGFSFALGDRSLEPGDTVGTESGDIVLSGLKNGNYCFSVKGFYEVKDGKTVTKYETSTASYFFTVKIRGMDSTVVENLDILARKITGKLETTIMSLSIIALLIIYTVAGSRIIFYSKLLYQRFKFRMRLFFS